MALREDVLAARLNEALRRVDEATAPASVREVKSQHTKQRIEMAKAIAEEVIRHIKEFAEVEVPDHDPFRTDPQSGPGIHAHTITPPLRHDRGRVL
jgi:hypothetical protein